MLSDDEGRFITLCQHGRLYEELMSQAGIPHRNCAKKAFFEVLFGTNQFCSPLKRRFVATFPGVAEVARLHKRNDYRFLSHVLQNIESHFVINTVCRRLMSELPEAPVFTIHDSILTTPKYAGRVQASFEDEFALIGLSPSFEITDYGKDSNAQR